MRLQSFEFGKHKFSLFPRIGWDDASFWTTWLNRYAIAKRDRDKMGRIAFYCGLVTGVILLLRGIFCLNKRRKEN